MLKKISFIILLIFFLESCQSMGDIKKGLTGEKIVSTDEFLVQKKDPLVMPPDYENLPNPEEAKETVTETMEISSFEKVLENSIEENTSSSGSSSTESSILKKIQSK